MSGFEAADEFDKAIMLWRAEMDLLDQDLRDKFKIEARIQDLYRNNDLMRGLVEKQVDALVGAKVRLQAMPDHEALGIDRAEALEWSKTVERAFHTYADSPENWISADRSMDFTQMIRQGARSKIMTGEIFCSREWLPSPLGYNTAFQVFSPSRVKTPSARKTDEKIFHGVEFNSRGAAVAYHVEEARTNQKRSFSNKQSKRVGKYTRFGWLQMFHIYEPFLPEYPRGISRLAAVLKKMKQLDRYNEADLDKNIIAASYVMAITSDSDPESVADMLSGANGVGGGDFAIAGADNLPHEIKKKRQEILEQIQGRYVELTGGQIMHLFSGEEAKILQAPVASQTSSDYTAGHVRSIANGIGMSYELGAGDFRGLSFSGGQLSLGIYEHSANIERRLYVHKLAKLIFRSWLDEAVDKGIVPLLGGKPYFPNKEAYARCEFTGMRRVHVDPVKAANSNRLNLANGTTSRLDIANAEGIDLESVMMNRAHEAEMILQAVDAAAKRNGIDIGDDARAKILVDVVSTENVEVADVTPSDNIQE